MPQQEVNLKFTFKHVILGEVFVVEVIYCCDATGTDLTTLASTLFLFIDFSTAVVLLCLDVNSFN